MQNAPQSNDEQATYWNGPGGQAWVEMQTVLDQVMAPFADLLIRDTPIGSVDRVLDIGCGAGATTLAATPLLRPNGRAIGVDISAPLIALAQSRAESDKLPASFICADAATYAFEPAAFDLLISRFGVMFFEDSIAAFANLRKAARPNATLRVAVWRGPEENPFMTTAERAARPYLPDIPDRKPNAPGQFAFADRRRTESILRDAGWSAIDIRAVDVDCSLPESALTRYLTKLGPLGRVLQDVEERKRIEIIESVRAAFDSFVFGATVRFQAACWIVSARA